MKTGNKDFKCQGCGYETNSLDDLGWHLADCPYNKKTRNKMLLWVVLALLGCMIIILALVSVKYAELNTELNDCAKQNDYYFERLSEANYRIMLADSITKTHGVLNPADTVWFNSNVSEK